MGRRVEKVAGGATTGYTYDGADIAREVRGAAALKYVHSLGMDEPLAVDEGTATSYFHADGAGTIVKVTSATGAVTLMRQYDAWGNLQSGADQPGYSYTGREWDPETGLNYYRYRYYDAGEGAFISEDPVDFGDGLSRYSYVLSNPVNLVDPMGLAPSCEERWPARRATASRDARHAAQRSSLHGPAA